MAKISYKLTLAGILALLLGTLFCLPAAAEDNITSPINGKVLEPADTNQKYSFLVAGHIYGGGSHGYPVQTFLANITRFNDTGARFFILLGDIISNTTESQISEFKYAVGDTLDMPMFNSPGNHDVMDRGLYSKHFGKTYSSFQYASELYILLDTEQNDAQIRGEQLDLVLNSLDKAGRSEDIKNIFILSHRLLWAINNEPVETIIPWVNGPGNHPETATSFKEYVLPELYTLSESKSVYLISGDIGAAYSLPLFYQKDPKYNITYAACGLGEADRDAVLKVDITGKGEVTFTPISLTGQELEEIDHYGIDYWSNYFSTQAPQAPQASIFETLWAKVRSVLSNIVFYLGIAFSVALAVTAAVGLIILRKVRARKA